MNTLNILLQAAPQQGGGMSFIIMMVLIFVIMWFFMIRPQQKKQKELQNYQNSLTPGTQVITQGGILGTVRGIDEANNIIKIEVANGVTIQVTRTAVFPANENPTNQK